MSIAGATILTGFLTLQNPVPFDNPQKEAWRHLSKALFLEFNLDDAAKRMEKRYAEPWMYEYGPYVTICYKVVAEKRISYTWRF